MLSAKTARRDAEGACVVCRQAGQQRHSDKNSICALGDPRQSGGPGGSAGWAVLLPTEALGMGLPGLL